MVRPDGHPGRCAEPVEEAHEFLNFMMEAEKSPQASNYVYYANGNKASQEFLSEDVIGDPAIYPDAETTANLYTDVALGSRRSARRDPPLDQGQDRAPDPTRQ